MLSPQIGQTQDRLITVRLRLDTGPRGPTGTDIDTPPTSGQHISVKTPPAAHILTNRELAGEITKISRNIANYRELSRGIEFDERMDSTRLRRLCSMLVDPCACCSALVTGLHGSVVVV